MIKSPILAAIALAAAALSATAQATTINLGSSLIDTVSASPSFSNGSLGVTIRGESNGSALDVAMNSSGVGYDSGFFDPGELNSSAGNNPGDFITFTFNQAVNLTGLTMTGWENGFDKAILSWGTNSIALNHSSSILTLKDTFNLSGVTGTTFKLQAVGAVSAFRLYSLDATPVAAVPEASTYALMGLGLVGIAAVRRRRAL